MRSDLDPAVVAAAMERYLTPAQIQQLGDLFARCVTAIAERRAARLVARTARSELPDAAPVEEVAS